MYESAVTKAVNYIDYVSHQQVLKPDSKETANDMFLENLNLRKAIKVINFARSFRLNNKGDTFYKKATDFQWYIVLSALCIDINIPKIYQAPTRVMGCSTVAIFISLYTCLCEKENILNYSSDSRKRALSQTHTEELISYNEHIVNKIGEQYIGRIEFYSGCYIKFSASSVALVGEDMPCVQDDIENSAIIYTQSLTNGL